MAEIPRRISLQDQVVELMRSGILGSRWQGHLPPESELCHEFQVSRMTLRKALAQLASERWIELGGRGRFHRICRRPRKAAAAVGRTVRLLTPFSFAELSSSFHAIIKVITDRLAKNGYRLEIECHPGVF
jgi:DNA-binding FadR family transcriptional regulator